MMEGIESQSPRLESISKTHRGSGNFEGSQPIALDVTDRRHSIGVYPSSLPSTVIATEHKEKNASKESFKVRKQTYKIKKKKVVKEFSSALKDKSVTILSSWIKIRGTLKSWAKYWCVVKPEVVIIYKNDKHHHWVGTILINNCEFFERPSSKEGFCFKIFQPYGQTIWATKGPKGEVAGALVQPMPKDHLILRADNEQIGRCWLDALEVSQQSSLVTAADKLQSDIYGEESTGGDVVAPMTILELPEYRNGFEDTFVGDKSDYSSGEEFHDEAVFVACAAENEPVEETCYYPTLVDEEFGESGETTEEMEEENKSILWALLKQVRPGMDLSKVTLPTFILEPRSFLDKLADYYFHSDLLAIGAKEENPYKRMKEVVKWYLSGFYKKPKGLKKPYNPIIGEMFRCMLEDRKDTSRTFFIAEQVSHHPPVSAFYCSNRKEGYAISGSILAKSKFYGNSTSAILDGTATLTFLKLGEDYTANMPYAHVKGILIGSLTAEYGGVVNIKCEKTGYSAEIEFKLKPFWKKSGECNYISGKIRMGNTVLSKIEGKWDGECYISEYDQGDEAAKLFFSPTPEVKRSRLRRYNVAMDDQQKYESEKLWMKVSEAILNADQTAATDEKLVLEDEQRKLHKELREKDEEWVPRYFERDPDSLLDHAWIYKYRDLRAWDPDTDLMQFEFKGILKTQTRHRVPLVKRTMSSANITLSSVSRDSKTRLPSIKEPDVSTCGRSPRNSDRSSLGSDDSPRISDNSPRVGEDFPRINEQLIGMLKETLVPVLSELLENKKSVDNLRTDVRKLNGRVEAQRMFNARDCILIIVVLSLGVLLQRFM